VTGLVFSTCFPRDKVLALYPDLSATYAALDEIAEWRGGRWPRKVKCMSKRDVAGGRARGAGHGYTYVRRGADEIWMNPWMTVLGYHLVLIHENLHHAFPDATEDELNNVLVPFVYTEATGKILSKESMRRAGLGPPEPGIGDRGYVY
jgi:hypothetical protein